MHRHIASFALILAACGSEARPQPPLNKYACFSAWLFLCSPIAAGPFKEGDPMLGMCMSLLPIDQFGFTFQPPGGSETDIHYGEDGSIDDLIDDCGEPQPVHTKPVVDDTGRVTAWVQDVDISVNTTSEAPQRMRRDLVYDAAGVLVGDTSREGTDDLQYDPAGDLTYERNAEKFVTGTIVNRYVYTYDGAGRITQQDRYPRDDATTPSDSWSFSYDDRGHMIGVGGGTTFTWDGDHVVEMGSSHVDYRLSYEGGQLVEEDVDIDGAPASTRFLDYDDLGRPSHITYWGSDPPPPP